MIVTHDQEEAMTVASRIAVMDNGRLIQVDTPDKIYETPNSVYVADFIGDVNLVEGRIGSSDGDKYSIHWAEGQPSISAVGPVGLTSGTKCHFAIRPEKVAISAEKPTDKANLLQGRILDIAYLGNVSTYHVELANGVIVKAQMANNRRISRRDLTWEDQVWLSFTDTAGLVLLK